MDEQANLNINIIKCECGSILLKKSLKRHLDSKKHKKFTGLNLKEDELRKAETTISGVEIRALDDYYEAKKKSWDFHQFYPKMFKLHSIYMCNYRILECDSFKIIIDANIPTDVYDKSVRLKKEENDCLTWLYRCREYTRDVNSVSIYNVLENILFRIKIEIDEYELHL